MQRGKDSSLKDVPFHKLCGCRKNLLMNLFKDKAPVSIRIIIMKGNEFSLLSDL